MKQLFATVAHRARRFFRGIQLRCQAYWYVSTLQAVMQGMQETYDKYVGTPLANLYDPNAHQRMRVAYVTCSDLYDQGRYRQALLASRRAYRQHVTG